MWVSLPLFGAVFLLGVWIVHLKLESRRFAAKNKALLESLGEGIVVTDKSGNVELINAQAELMVGWKNEQVVGKKWYEIAPLEDEKGIAIPAEKRATQTVLTTGKPKSNNTYYYRRKDGSRFAVGTTAAPVILGNETVGVIAVFRDISKEREIDRSKSEFVSLASHQLRTPLSAIKWFVEMLAVGDFGKLTSEQQEAVENIKLSNERMIELVNSLLNISRIESGRIIIDPVDTDVRELIEQTVEPLKIRFADRKISVLLKIDSHIGKIKLDPKMISQVVQNLVTNAMKYSNQGGEIVVETKLDGDMMVVAVADHGYGIPDKEKKRLFEKFYRGSNILNKETDGTGLGLYLVKAIVESSGGKVWFESQENVGTTFWFSLPIAGVAAKPGEVTLT